MTDPDRDMTPAQRRAAGPDGCLSLWDRMGWPARIVMLIAVALVLGMNIFVLILSAWRHFNG